MATVTGKKTTSTANKGVAPKSTASKTINTSKGVKAATTKNSGLTSKKSSLSQNKSSGSTVKKTVGGKTTAKNPKKISTSTQKVNQARKTTGKSYAKKSTKYKFANQKLEKWSKHRQQKQRMPMNNGIWKGKKGESNFVKKHDVVPKKSNPKGENWKNICKRYGVDPNKGIPFKNGKPNFEAANPAWSKNKVNIKGFSSQRGSNFSKADQALAKKNSSTPKAIKEMRSKQRLTWHEVNSSGDMILVPSAIHNNVPHKGGISEIKDKQKMQATKMKGKFTAVK